MSLHRHEIDFEIINTGNPKTIVFMDSSSYFEAPDRPLLQITPPGFSKFFTVNIAYGKLNTLNSNIIGLSHVLDTSALVDLPDGVWTFVYRICPYDKIFITKFHLRTVHLKKKLNQLFDLAGTECDFEHNPQFKKEMVDIFLLIAKGEANAQEGEPAKASDAYQKASRRVNKLLDKLIKAC
jgi:hypothetical protein